MFSTLTFKKIVKVNNIINKSSMVKPKIKMTTKGPSRKQVIISISESNSNITGSNASFYINTINRHLKEANSNNMADLLHADKASIITTSLLQTQDLRVDQEKEPCIRVNTRELDRELFTRLSTFYTKGT